MRSMHIGYSVGMVDRLSHSAYLDCRLHYDCNLPPCWTLAEHLLGLFFAHKDDLTNAVVRLDLSSAWT